MVKFNKVTHGKVIQTLDSELKRCIDQKFVPNEDLSEYLTVEGKPLSPIIVPDEDEEEDYDIPGFGMIDPKNRTMTEWLLKTVITETFERFFGRFQMSKPEDERVGMLVTFGTYDHLRDSHSDSRYPRLDILLYAHGAGVCVLTRSYVIHSKLPGDMTREESKWEFHSDHDVCWRDTLNTILFQYHGQLHNIETMHGLNKNIVSQGWYAKMKVSEEDYRGFVALKREKRESFKR